MINSELKKMIPLIIEKNLHFNKGNVSGYSIEVEEVREMFFKLV